ncbi:MAG: hypothetical protein LBO64_08115 [Desulfovibrio sp.]|nr:hypothetical protein [Desulfovibrio sp.]
MTPGKAGHTIPVSRVGGGVTNINKDFGTLSPETASPRGLPAHPGALKFWQSLADEK